MPDFDELNNLFFQVLAEKPAGRRERLAKKFSNVPYLNSSLFERTELERRTIDISALDNGIHLPLYEKTVLKTLDGKRTVSNFTTLSYLFAFLDSYNFASEGNGEIQEENKTLINASVLGLIFEKINGYKDGSFFTPGFITMYMCRETLRRAVVEKCNEVLAPLLWRGVEVRSFDELKDKIDFHDKDARAKANAIINSITICDPAVGSGHFLVSALNELIAIKHDLKIFQYRHNGQRIKEYSILVENDELIIQDIETEELFDYRLNRKGSGRDELQALQETLFHEKETLIENCLFGVDINANSVKICRLRLWIELLKNAYYTKESNYTELETLPNIDINIKQGNSLISRFAIDADLTPTLTKSKWTIDSYKAAVQAYRSAQSKEEKREMETLIDTIKKDFKTDVVTYDPLNKKLSKLRGELALLQQKDLFSGDAKKKTKANALLEKLTQQIAAAEKEKDETKNNAIYKDAFEWRFEFPEVLDGDGKFLGFDVVIGNPPYIPLESFSQINRDYFKDKFEYFERKFETSVLFIIQALRILNNQGYLSFIAPATWQTGENYAKFRKYIFENCGLKLIINLPFNTFEDAYVDTGVYLFIKKITHHYKIYNYKKKDKSENIAKLDLKTIDTSLILKPYYKVILDPTIYEIINRLNKNKFITLGEITKSTQGLSASNFLQIREGIGNGFPFLQKGNVYNYYLSKENVYDVDMSQKDSLKQFYLAEEKVLIRRIINRQDRLSVAYTQERMVFKKDINPFICTDKNYLTKFLLALLASRLISFIYTKMSSIATKDDFRQTTLKEIRNILIPKVNIEAQLHFVDLVDKILSAKKENPKADTTVWEKEIDALVYKLYDLSEEEIKIVEG